MTNLRNWDKTFQSPFKSDVYFFSLRQQTNQRWGTSNPIVFREKEFGAIRVKGHGIYAYHISDPHKFYAKISGTLPIYRALDLEGQLRNTIVGIVADTFASSNIPFLDLAANQIELSRQIAERGRPVFEEVGIELDNFVVQNLSLPEEIQKILDQKIGINIIGDLNKYTQYQVAQAIPTAAANEGGVSGVGTSLAVGLVMGKQIASQIGPEPAAPISGKPSEDKFCLNCGQGIPRRAVFCTDCGAKQQ